MEYVEADPLPIQCQKCEEQYCEECDYLGQRFLTSEEDQRRLDRAITAKQRLWRLKWKQARRRTN